MALPCQQSSWVRNTNGSIDLVVTARFSIATGDLGGLDTGEMNSDTSVVEILLEGEAPYDETQKECDKSSNDSGMLSIGPDCHFYGVDLYRPGFYKVYKDGDPASGVCTLNLSR
jgi:hypothetical protein